MEEYDAELVRDHIAAIEVPLVELVEQQQRAEMQGRLGDARRLQPEIDALHEQLVQTAEVIAGPELMTQRQTEGTMAQDFVDVEDLPPELRSRVAAASAHAQYRVIDRCRPGDQAGSDEYEVYALAGDRVVHMRLSMRPDGSVAEATETFLRQEILRVDMAGEHAAVEVENAGGQRTIPIPMGLAATLTS